MAEPLKNQGLGIVVGAVAVALVAGILFVATRKPAPPPAKPGYYQSLLQNYDAKQAQLDYIQQTVDDIRYKQMYPSH